MKLSAQHIEEIQRRHTEWLVAMAEDYDSLRAEEADGAFWDYVSRVVPIDFGEDFEAWCLKATQLEIAEEAMKRIWALAATS